MSAVPNKPPTVIASLWQEGNKRTKRRARQSVFESTPVQSKADVHSSSRCDDISMDSMKSMFESQPARSKADVGANSRVDIVYGGSVFESRPTKSKADAISGWHAYDAVQVTYGSTHVNLVFESKPQKSTAAVKHAEQIVGKVGKSVFESKPQKSKAMVSHGDAVKATPDGPSVFESTPQLSQADISSHAPTPATSDAAQSVFENQPTLSLASTRYGEEDVESDSAYTTDDGEES